jgi:hypothetical protein
LEAGVVGLAVGELAGGVLRVGLALFEFFLEFFDSSVSDIDFLVALFE